MRFIRESWPFKRLATITKGECRWNRRNQTAFPNEYWPTDYIVDAQGRIRYHHFDEGKNEKSECVIQSLLKENEAAGFDESTIRIPAEGAKHYRVKIAQNLRRLRSGGELRVAGRLAQMALNPAKNGTPVRYRLKLNAAAPDDDDGRFRRRWHGRDSAGRGCIIATFYGNRLWI